MELLKLATEWAKSEVFSTRFFIFFAIGFLIASAGFWQLGKTDLAKAYSIPTLVAGILLLIIGSGLNYTNIQRVKQFEKDFNTDATAFYQSEIERTESTLKEYAVVFKVIPILIILEALVILFTNSPTWRAISITIIAMLIIILLVDGTAHSRIESYYKELKLLALKNEIKK
jgi:drug/metabolite transporter (DMT)-like permease